MIEFEGNKVASPYLKELLKNPEIEFYDFTLEGPQVFFVDKKGIRFWLGRVQVPGRWRDHIIRLELTLILRLKLILLALRVTLPPKPQNLPRYPIIIPQPFIQYLFTKILSLIISAPVRLIIPHIRRPLILLIKNHLTTHINRLIQPAPLWPNLLARTQKQG